VLRYASVERVVHVDIDPVMLHLAETNPALVRMNGRPHDDPRVTLVVGDAFAWLRRGSERFDAVYVDVPRARDYNLSILYSQEFYSLLRRRLQPGGLLAMDAPDGSCGVEGSLWPTYVSTLHAAGFDDVRSFVSKPDLDDPRVSVSLALLSNEMELTAPLEGGGEMQLTPAQVRQYLETTMRRDFTEQEFILARAERGGLHDEWRDPGFELAAFGPGSFALTLQTCPDVFAPERVNSLFRPTLPELHLAGVTFP
jgi:spermidine synthase